MRRMIGLPSRRERSGPGGSPGLQNQWRGARRGAVGSTPTRSRHGGSETCRPSARVHRASSGCWPRSGRGSPSGARRRTRSRAVAREVVAERAGPAGGRRAAPTDARRRWRAAVADRLDGVRRPGGERPDARSSTRPASILHTNLGRAPWPAAAIEAATPRPPAATRSSSSTARPAGAGRGSGPPRTHLIALTGAEDALVTVNNAAALALAVGLAGRRGVAVSRGELVEIGGGVRIPEIVRRTGARLVEVGTTNRTRASDFEAPLADGRATRRPARPSVELRPDRVRRGARRRSSSRGSPTRTARSSSTTSAAARCSRRRRSGSPTSRCPPSGWRPAPTSSRSAATSWSVGRRPG